MSTPISTAVTGDPDARDVPRRPRFPRPMSENLFWANIQGFLFVSGVWSQTSFEGLTDFPWYWIALEVFLMAWVAYAIVRNLIRLWQTPTAEATPWHLLPLLLFGALFTLMSIGPLLNSERMSTKPSGAIWLILRANLLALAAREVWRVRSQRRAGAR